MAREYASIKLTIWSDDDWRDLSPMAKLLYLSIITSPTLSHCGVADWRPARLAASTGMTRAQVEEAGAEMVESLHLVIDDEAEEVMVRSFLRHDGLMKQPKMATAMATAHAGVASSVIRGVIVHELKRLRETHADLHGWGSEKATDLLKMRSVDPSTYPLPKGSSKGSVKGSRKGKSTPTAKGSTNGSGTTAPTTAPSNSHLPASDELAAADVSSATADGSFEEFWAVYPRKVDRGHAAKAWPRALKKAPAADIIDGCRIYALSVANTEPRFVAHGATWLNGERWLDFSAATDPGRIPQPGDPDFDPEDPRTISRENAWMRQGGGA